LRFRVGEGGGVYPEMKLERGLEVFKLLKEGKSWGKKEGTSNKKGGTFRFFPHNYREAAHCALPSKGMGIQKGGSRFERCPRSAVQSERDQKATKRFQTTRVACRIGEGRRCISFSNVKCEWRPKEKNWAVLHHRTKRKENESRKS